MQQAALMKMNVQELISSGQAWRLDSLFSIHARINRAIMTENTLLRERKQELDNSTSQYNILTTVFAVLAAGIILFTFISNLFISKHRNWLEGFLESILNTSQNGIVHFKAIRVMDEITDFRIAFANKAIERLLGLPPSQVAGKKLSEVNAYKIDPVRLEKYKEVVETGKPNEFESLYKREGRDKWFLVSLAKLDDGVIASFHDITQLKKYEAELKENISNLEKSNLELEQYAYVASHDLQEPLRKIRSFGSFLQDTQAEKLDEKGRMQLKKMMDSAERMSTLIKDIPGLFQSAEKSFDGANRFKQDRQDRVTGS